MTPTGRDKELDVFVGLRMPAWLKTALERLATKEDRPLSMYIRRVLEQHVEAQKGKGK